MADQVEITNVGGEGVASEVTLANLLAITEEMAKKKGINPEEVTKKLNALRNSASNATESTEKNTTSKKDNTAEVKKSSNALKKFSSAVGNAALSSISSLARSATNMTSAFIEGSNRLDSFIGQIPLVGSQLGILASYIDNSFAAFQDVAGSGAAFNNSLTELRTAAAGARMPLQEFTGMISANSDKLATFGGTATQGAQQIVALNRALGGNREDLLSMGLNYQEINEALIDYQYLQRAGNRGVRLSQQQQVAQAQAAADYTKNLVTLGKLTGQDVKTQQEAIARAQMDVAMQAKLATLSVDERKKMDQLMADTMASGGQAAVDQLRLQFLGMAPMTQDMALYQSQFGESVNAISNGLNRVYDANVSVAQMSNQSTDFMMDMINGNAQAFARLEPGITAAAAGLDGPMATLAEQLRGAGIQFTDFINRDTGEVDQVRLRTAIENAKAETAASDNSTRSMASFMETLNTVREAFTNNIVTPLMNAVMPALRSLTTALSPSEDGTNTFMSAITKVGDWINNDLAPGILKFIEAFKEDPKKAILDLFTRGTESLTNVIKDFFLGTMMTGPLMPGQEREREGGFLKETLLPIMAELGTGLVNGMVEGVKYLWENTNIIETMVAGIAALWAGKALMSAMVSGAGSLMAAGLSRMRTPSGAPGPAPAGGGGGARAGGGLRNFAGRAARRLGAVGAIGYGLYEGYQGYSAANEALERGEITQSQATVQQSEAIGGAAGGTGGALAGAALGATAGSVVPIIGTAIGGLIGGAIGWWAGNAGGEALGGIIGESIAEPETDVNNNSTTTPDAPTPPPVPPITPPINSPGAQLAMMMTAEEISAMERIAAVDFTTFNAGLQELRTIDLSGLFDFGLIDTSDFVNGIKTFAEIPDLARNIGIINSLNAENIKSYASSMEDLADALEKINDALSEDNKGMFGGGTGVAAKDMLGEIGRATSGTSESTQQLNTIMQQIYMLLQEMKTINEDIESNTSNIIGSNLAQGGVSNVGR